MELKKLGEFGLIEKIARSAGAGFPDVIKGIGDDAAVVRSSKTQCQLLSTDTLIEGIHFERALTTPYLLGKKCIAVNLSDIAAMGGTPVCFVVSLSIPPKTPYEFIHKLYQGMIHRARAFGVSLVGGDTTGSRDHMVITVTVLGTARTDRVIYRHGARPGDRIYVTGSLGDAALGLSLLQRRKALSRIRPLIKKHLDPLPRVSHRLAGRLHASRTPLSLTWHTWPTPAPPEAPRRCCGPAAAPGAHRGSSPGWAPSLPHPNRAC